LSTIGKIAVLTLLCQVFFGDRAKIFEGWSFIFKSIADWLMKLNLLQTLAASYSFKIYFQIQPLRVFSPLTATRLLFKLQHSLFHFAVCAKFSPLEAMVPNTIERG